MFMNHEIPNRLPSIHYIHEKKQFLANDIFGIMILDQYSYLRWLSVYIQDYLSLPITSRKIYQKIEGGNFVLHISGRQFSRIHYDQLNNKISKYGSNCASRVLQSR